MRIIFSSNNLNKLKEARSIFESFNISDVVSLNDVDCHVNPIEDGNTFEENAKIKALSVYHDLYNKKKLTSSDIIVSDDTGLCIDYLNGAPSIYSARFLGVNATQAERNNKIIELLNSAKIEERKAHFTTVICAIFVKNALNGLLNEGSIRYFTGIMNGYITPTITDGGGFGYDPIFGIGDPSDISNNCVKSYASIGENNKNLISHRQKAIHNLCEYLEKHHNI